MFKNLTIYRIGAGFNPGLAEVEAALDGNRFAECGPSQDLSYGWVPPREQNGALVEAVAGQRVIKLLVETKKVPASAVLKHAQAAADAIEQTTGRKPGRKEMQALREDAMQALLPQAFPKQSAVLAWFDHERGLLMLDTGSQSDTDLALTALVRAFPSLQLSLLNTQITPQTAMTGWLSTTDTDEWPAGFAVERECELKSDDEEKSVVRYKRHHLLTDEVRQHLQQGKRPTLLAMSWEGRVSFTLTDAMQIKAISFLEGVFDGQKDDGADKFDADMALATGELRNMIPALVNALGGELAPCEFPEA